MTWLGDEPSRPLTSASEKYPSAADTFGGGTDLARIERIALDGFELAPDDPVQRRRVALDIDALNEHPFAARHHEFQIQRQRRVVAGDPRLDADEPQALLRSASCSSRVIVESTSRGE